MKVLVDGNTAPKILKALVNLLTEKQIEFVVLGSASELSELVNQGKIIVGSREFLDSFKHHPDLLDDDHLVHVFNKGERIKLDDFGRAVKGSRVLPKKRELLQHLNALITPMRKVTVYRALSQRLLPQDACSIQSYALNLGVVLDIQTTNMGNVGNILASNTHVSKIKDDMYVVGLYKSPSSVFVTALKDIIADAIGSDDLCAVCA